MAERRRTDAVRATDVACGVMLIFDWSLSPSLNWNLKFTRRIAVPLEHQHRWDVTHQRLRVAAILLRNGER